MKKILIAGGSGIVGRALANYMTDRGHQVKSLTRHPVKRKEEEYLFWDPDKQLFDLEGYEPEYVVNLSGARIVDEKWSKKRKEIIIKSRTESTRFLINQLLAHQCHLTSFISASAIGYYGDTGNKLVDESDEPSTDEFISQVCQLWEDAAEPAQQISRSVSILRISTVLTQTGGALEKMDRTIPLGMANYLGNGKQYLSWIHIEDLCGIIDYCFNRQYSYNIYNVSAPEIVTNYEFTKVLRDTINPRAILLPAPSLTLKLLLGEMSRVVLNSSRINSNKIISDGYTFLYPNLSDALADIYSST